MSKYSFAFFQDSRDASEEQALNSSNFDASNDLIELSDDDEFDEAMAEVIIKLMWYFKALPVQRLKSLQVEDFFWYFGKMMCIFLINPWTLSSLLVISPTINNTTLNEAYSHLLNYFLLSHCELCDIQ